jgi:hypothetical protein
MVSDGHDSSRVHSVGHWKPPQCCSLWLVTRSVSQNERSMRRNDFLSAYTCSVLAHVLIAKYETGRYIFAGLAESPGGRSASIVRSRTKATELAESPSLSLALPYVFMPHAQKRLKFISRTPDFGLGSLLCSGYTQVGEPKI